MGLLKTAVISLTLAVVTKYIVDTVILVDTFSFVHNHAPGPCRLVEGVENGSEDIEVLPNGLAFITSGLKFLKDVGNPAYKHRVGKIQLFDFTKPDKSVVTLRLEGGPSWENFSPHGISLWHDQGKLYVYVVNHDVSGEKVEKFIFDEKNLALKHLKSITHETFSVLNDLVMVGEDQFYVSRYHWSSNSLGWMLESFLRLRWGQLLFFDGAETKVAADGFLLPNGVNISPDKKYVYLAVAMQEKLSIFTRNSDNSLELKQEIDVHTAPDNIDVITENNGQIELWIGAHPIGWKILMYLEHARDSAPSQVLRLVMDGDGDNVRSITEVYAEDGVRLYASSSAVKYKNDMLVGSVIHKLMYCELKYIDN